MWILSNGYNNIDIRYTKQTVKQKCEDDLTKKCVFKVPSINEKCNWKTDKAIKNFNQ